MVKYSKDDFQAVAQGLCPGPDLEWFAVDDNFWNMHHLWDESMVIIAIAIMTIIEA
ncbi:hypothetical protein ACSYAD_15755 [Acaryochloris marina NIES-2412]|uniref:hypothetical protein n=1 Tax=Acaryochloris marina TaxID=155978 RepID=UPI004059AA2A